MLRSVGIVILMLSLSGSILGQDLRWTAVKASIRAAYPGVQHLTVERLAEEMRTGETSILFLDARAPEEFAVSHLRGALRIDPDAETFPELAQVARDRPVVVYCSVGYRSARVARLLGRLGWTNVRNLEGSIFEWANEGHPLVQGERPVELVHPFNRRWGRLLDAARHAPIL